MQQTSMSRVPIIEAGSPSFIGVAVFPGIRPNYRTTTLWDFGGMNQPEIYDRDIRALQEWLRGAWRQLGDPSLTTFARRELRNQMKQCSDDLKACLQRMEAQPQPVRDSDRSFARPELRILA